MIEVEEKKTSVPTLRFPKYDDSWKEYRLGNICSNFKSGSTITSRKIYDKGSYPVYGGNGLRGFTDNFNHTGRYLLIGRQGALCGNINLIDGKNFISEHAIAVKGNELADTDWLAHKLKYFNLNRLSESSAQPGLSVKKLVRLKIVVPTLKEQQKIASFLSAIDKRIDLLEQKKAKLEEYKKGVMHKIFSREIRFKPRFEDLDLLPGTVADLAADFPDWEEKKLGEIAKKESSSISANTLEKNNGEFKIYGATGFLRNVDFYEQKEPYISIVKDGAGVGRTLLCDAFSSVLGTLDIIKPRKETNLIFLYYQLNQIRFTKYITGSTIPHIYFKDYSKEKLMVPCIEEQNKIAAFLGSIDEKIVLVEKQIKDSSQFKKGLLQQMFV